MTLTPIDYVVVGVIVLLLLKIIHQMATITDLRALLDRANAAVTTITANEETLKSELAGAIGATDAASLVTGFTDLVTKLETLATPPATGSTAG